jgi:hydroxymethylpyrimidine pyrophosphatase-like HAD family hydrolase
MQFLALASDYDGTLADDGRLAPVTRDALARLRRSGCKVILVTGRELTDLKRVCPELTLFDRVVTENGAVLVDPIPGTERLLAQGAPPELFAQLRARGLSFLYRGQVIVATTEDNETALRDSLLAVGLDWRLIFNKGAVMALPAGVDKALGLRAALEEVGVDPQRTVGVGDAENDVPLLEACGLGVAVAGATDSLKAIAHRVMPSDHGAGVVELIDCWLADGPASAAPR